MSEPFERTADRKTAALVAAAGRGRKVVVANSHGFPAGLSCPGRTDTCAGPSHLLDVEQLERLAAAATAANGGRRGQRTAWRVVLPAAGIDARWPCYVVSDLRRGTEENACWRNWERLRTSMSAADIESAVGATLDEFTDECAAAGVDPLYRLHWDGDFVDEAHAVGTAAAVRARPHLTVWVYTRSLFAVEHLDGIDNLAVYVSADIDNVEAVRSVLAAHPDVLVAALGVDGDEAAKVLSLLDRRRSPICPVDTGRLPTVVALDRRGEPERGADGLGACAACRLCVDGLRDVRFTLRKQPWARRHLTMPGPVTIDDRDGPALLFADRHADQLRWWRRLDPELGDTQRAWRRLYVTYRRDGRHVASMQPRGRRLIVTVTGIGSDTPPGDLLSRDITGIGHQMPGDVELTVDSDTGCELAAGVLAAVAAQTTGSSTLGGGASTTS